MRKLIAAILFLTILPLAILKNSHAEVYEEYENKYFWKIDILKCGAGLMYNLDGNKLDINARATLLELSFVYPKLKLGIGAKLSTDFIRLENMLQPDWSNAIISLSEINYPMYLYFMPFFSINDKLSTDNKSGETKVKRKVRPTYFYIGYDFLDANGQMIDAGVCWAPSGLFSFKLGFIDISSDYFMGYDFDDNQPGYATYSRGIYIQVEITLGIGWRAKIKSN